MSRLTVAGRTHMERARSLTLVRPRRRLTSAPTAGQPARAAAVMDGRHVDGEACLPLPGRSLTAASTAAHCGGSGLHEGAHPPPSLAARPPIAVAWRQSEVTIR